MGQKMWGCRYVLAIAAAMAIGSSLRAEDIVTKAAPKSHSRVEAERRIEAALDLPLRAPLEFIQTPLNQIMAVLSDDYEIPILFDTSALDAVACSPEIEVTINVGNVSLRSALDLMLRNAGSEELTYINENEVLLITTQEEEEKRLEVRVYRVDDLLDDDEATCDRLIDIIVSSVEHEAWMENGTGEGEALSYPPGMIIISQTQRVHSGVERLLDQMRSAKRGILADAAKSSATASSQPITRSIRINDRIIADSEQARNSLRDAIQKSVDWQLDVDGVDRDGLFLYVLPNRVLVRHVPEVANQVARVVRKLSPLQEPMIGNYGTASGMRGRGGSGGGGMVEGSGPTPDLAEPTKASEDGEQRQQAGGEGFF